MPMRAREGDDFVTAFTREVGELLGFFEDFSLAILSLLVELNELFADFNRDTVGVRRKEFHTAIGVAHSACCVDQRRNAITDGACGNATCATGTIIAQDVGMAHQRADTWAFGACDLSETFAHKDAVVL